MYKLRLGGLYIELTSVCNRNCPYCYNDSSIVGMQLDKKVIFRLLDECKQSGITSVSLSGGEPFLHPDIDEILIKLEELCMRAIIISNLSYVSIEKAVDLASYGHLLQITFDSPEEHENDITRGDGSYDLNIELIERFKQEGLLDSIILRYNVNKNNFNKTEDIIRLALDYGTKSIDLSLLFRSGRGSSYKYVFDYNNDLQEIASLMTQFHLFKERYKTKINITYSKLNDQLGCVLFGEGDLLIGPKIEPNGDVYICQLFSGKENSIGNVHKATLKTILKSDSARRLVDLIRKRKQIQSECGNCAFTDVCMCGCPAVSYNQTGNLLQKNDQCAMIRYFLKERVKQIKL